MSKLLVTNEIGLAEVLASSPGKQCRTTNRSLNMKSREEIFKRGRIKMEFRKLTEQDLPSLLELYKQLQPDDEASSEKRVKLYGKKSRIIRTYIILELLITVKWYLPVLLYTYRILQETVEDSVSLRML